MSELILCQREEITPVADAIRDLCAKQDGMNLVAMRANISNAAAAMQVLLSHLLVIPLCMQLGPSL